MTTDQQTSFFEEHRTVDGLLRTLTELVDRHGTQQTTTKREEEATEREVAQISHSLVQIFSKYQEQGQLIDPHMDAIVSPLLHMARTLFHTDNAPQRAQARNTTRHAVFKILYTLANVRGCKALIKRFSHDISELEHLFEVLTAPDQSLEWETEYILLLWLSLIVINPFDLQSVDSARGIDDTPLSLRMVQMGKDFLRSPSKSRDGAALFLARLLTRPDMRQKELPDFLEWSVEQLQSVESSVFLKSGVALTLTYIFKFGKREDLLNALPMISDFVCSSEGHQQITSGSNSLLRKLFVKLLQRVALTYLKMRVVKWRYTKDRKSLLHNLTRKDRATDTRNEMENNNNANQDTDNNDDDDEDIVIPEQLEDIIGALLDALSDTDTIVRWSAAKGIGRITMRLPKEMADDVVASLLSLFQEDEEPNTWHGGCLALAELARRGLLLPSRLEEVVNGIVVPGLYYDKRRGNYSVGNHVRDAACYVCWAFARAYDPKVMQPFVHNLAINLVTTSVYDREINVRRAASAAFQEHVGRQGNFPHGIDILTRADYFTLSNRQNAYQDISLYIAQFEEYRRPLIDHLMETKVMHWDKNIRELATQTLAKLALLDAQYMLHVIIPRLVPQTLDSNISTRHGSLVALGRTIESVSQIDHIQLDDNIHQLLRQVVIDVESKHLNRGKGGEIMREALCVYIKCLARAHISLVGTAASANMVAKYQETLDENLRHPNDSIVELAVQAFESFCDEYYDRCAVLSEEEFARQVIDRHVHTLKVDICNFSARRGYVLALSVIPRRLFASRFESIVDMLIERMRPEENPELRDAESRRNASRALIELCERSCSPLSSPRKTRDDALTPSMSMDKLAKTIFQALVDGTEDYAMDNRGDVGSWVREECMKGMERWVRLLSSSEQLQPLLTPSMLHKTACALMKQACEKIDRVRDLAGNILERLVMRHENDTETYEQVREKMPHHAHLERTILDVQQRAQSSTAIMVLDWSNPEITFPLFAEMGLRATEVQDPYMYSVLSGFVLSIGGLTNHVVKPSSETLVNTMTADGDSAVRAATICEALKTMQERYSGQDRVIIPLLKTIHLLLSRDCLQDAPFPLLRELVLRFQREVSSATCKSVVKLLEAIPIYCEFARFNSPNDELRRRSYGYLFHLLVNRFPRVRVTASEKLFNMVQVFAEEVFTEDLFQGEEDDNDDDDDEFIDSVIDVLMSTDWSDSIANLRPAVAKLYDMLHLPRPKSLQSIVAAA